MSRPPTPQKLVRINSEAADVREIPVLLNRRPPTPKKLVKITSADVVRLAAAHAKDGASSTPSSDQSSALWATRTCTKATINTKSSTRTWGLSLVKKNGTILELTKSDKEIVPLPQKSQKARRFGYRSFFPMRGTVSSSDIHPIRHAPKPPEGYATIGDLVNNVCEEPQHEAQHESPWNTPDAMEQIHDAVKRDQPQRVRTLLSGPDPLKRVPADIVNHAGETPALCAARHRRVSCCVTLLDGHADPLARDGAPNAFGDGVWPDEQRPDLHGKPPRHRLLGKPEVGRTVIYHLRATRCFQEVMSLVFPITRVLIIRAIADYLQHWHEKLPLCVAATQGSCDLVSLLLAHSALVPEAAPSPWPSPRSRFGLDPSWLHRHQLGSRWAPSKSERSKALLLAVAAHHWRCAELLVATSVNNDTFNSRCDKQGRTMLHVAAVSGPLELIEQLLMSGACPSVHSDTGLLPLHCACMAGRADVARILLAKSADVDSRVRDSVFRHPDAGRTPLEVAKARGHNHLEKLLLGGDVSGFAGSLVGTSASEASGTRPRTACDNSPTSRQSQGHSTTGRSRPNSAPNGVKHQSNPRFSN